MAANIRSLVNGASQLDGSSRDDVAVGNTVTVSSVDSATTYAWTLAFVPEGSTATFSGEVTTVSPGGFVTDKEGPYLVRLTVDAGLGTESTQYVRLRVPTVFGSLKLVAAGERRDGTGVIPVDVDTEGWTNEQNANIQTLLGFTKSVSSSGRIFYVDANAGGAVGYADYATVQAAIDAADALSPTLAAPYVIAIRPGLYTENITLKTHIHLVGWPGNLKGHEDNNVVAIRGTHGTSLANSGDRASISGITLETVSTGTAATLDKTGQGELTLHRCHIAQDGISGTQGPALALTNGSLIAHDCWIEFASGGAASRTAFNQPGSGTTSEFYRCKFKGPSGANINISGLESTVTCSMWDCLVQTSGSGATGIQSSAELLLLEYTRIEMDGSGTPLAIHPSGGSISGDVRGRLRYCWIDGGITIDDTGVAGTGALHVGACYHGGVTPTGSPTQSATVLSSTVFYDNTTTSMTAADVQAALDEVHALAVLVTSLDDAYDNGVAASGGGRTIIADQGSVQIVDAASPSDPPPAANTNGSLEVVSNVKIGALTKPEIDLDPNPYGSGPQISLGQTVVPADIAHAEGNVRLLAKSNVSTARNYNLLIQTESGINGSDIGNLIIQGGDSLPDATPPNAADLYLLAGSAYDLTNGGDAGHLYLSPGQELTGSTAATVRLVDPTASTAATLTANAAGADPIGVTGSAIFATSMGAVTLSVTSSDTLAAVITALGALQGISAADSGGGVIRLTTDQRGPTAEIHLLSATAGVNAALGDFTVAGGATFVAGTFAKVVDLYCSDTQEITIGNGTNDFIYNAVTGKMTVPGLIDPTGIIFEEAGVPSTGATQAGLFVGDGTGGTVQGQLFFREASDGSLVNLSASSNTLDQAYDQGGSGSGRTITADSGAVTINNAVNDTSHTLALTRTVGTGSALDIGTNGFRVFGDGDTVIGAAAMLGTEKLYVVGDTYLSGKLTVTGLIDPTGLVLDAQGSSPAGDVASKGIIYYTTGKKFIFRDEDGIETDPLALGPATFVFRPDGTASGNVYTSWATLYTALAAAEGRKEIVIDPTNATPPVVIPAGTYDLEGGVLTSGGARMGASATKGRTLVQLAQGVTITNLRSVRGLGLYNAGTTSPIKYNSGGSEVLSLTTVALVAEAGKEPVIEVTGGTTLEIWAWESDFTTNGGSNPTLKVDATSTLKGTFLLDSGFAEDTIESAVGGTLGVFQMDASSSYDTTQPSHAGSGPTITLLTDSAKVSYDNTTSGLTADDVQAAIDEVVSTFTGNTLDAAYDQGGSGSGKAITVDSGAVSLTNAVADGSNTLDLVRSSGTGTAAALDIGSGSARLFGDGDLVLGTGTMSGTERLRVSGDQLLEGNLTQVDAAASLLERTTTNTNAVQEVVSIKATSSNDMVDGFGPYLGFVAKDSAADNEVARIAAVRAGGDQTADLVFYTGSGGAPAARVWIDDSGNVGVGAAPTAESLELSGAVKVGDSAGTADGTVRYDSTANDFEGRKSGAWVSLTQYLMPYHWNHPTVAADTIVYKGWAATPCKLLSIKVLMETPNTVGNYTLVATNIATGNTMLSTNFNMNSISADTLTAVTLTGTSADLAFVAGDKWTVTLISDVNGFDGEDLYIELIFEAD